MDQMSGKRDDRPYAGRTGLLLARASTKQQDMSVADQLKDMRAFCEREGVSVVDEMRLEGVSGSKVWARKDINAILRRKTDRNDFDLLVVYDVSRLTRGGVLDGFRIEGALNEVGVELVYSSEPRYEGGMNEVNYAFKLLAANEYASQLAKVTCRGQQSAVEQGRLLKGAGYGVDRLLMTPQGEPRVQIRQCEDLSQLVLDPKTKEVIERHAPRDTEGGSRYRKQRHDTVQFCPGDPSHVDVVRRIFRRRYLDNVGTPTICRELNADGIASPRGRSWAVNAIEGLLLNPVYVGLAIMNRYASGIHYSGGAAGPTATRRSVKVKAGVERPAVEIRSPSDWVVVPQPQMEEFLPPEVKERAKKFILDQWERKALGLESGRSRDRHRNSSFFLKGILRSRADGHPLYGLRGGRYRYYFSKYIRTPGVRPEKYHRIRADLVEKVVLEALAETLAGAPNQADSLRREFARLTREAAAAAPMRATLTQQIAKLQREAEFIHSNRATYGDDVALSLLRRNQDERTRVQRQLTELAEVDGDVAPEPEDAVRQVVQQMEQLSAWLPMAPQAAVRQVLELFIARADVDFSDRSVALEFRLPEWALRQPSKFRLDPTSGLICGDQAKTSKSLHLRSLRLHYVYSQGCPSRYVQVEGLEPAPTNRAPQGTT